MFDKVLVATSANDPAHLAAGMGFSLTRRHGSELVFFHSCELPADRWLPREILPGLEELAEGTAKNIRKEIEAQDGAGDASEITVRVAFGSVPEEIVRMARRESCSLIVMGPHALPEAALDRMWGMVDNNVERVCQDALCPVLVVSRPVRREVSDVKTIVAATDLTTPSDRTIEYACQVAEKYKARLLIFHTLDMGLLYPNPKYCSGQIDVQIADAIETMACRYRKMLTGVDHEFSCWEGVPFVEILKFARWHDADMIVMAHHQKKKDSHKAFIGSTVSQIALTPSCPVMIINYRARAFD